MRRLWPVQERLLHLGRAEYASSSRRPSLLVRLREVVLVLLLAQLLFLPQRSQLLLAHRLLAEGMLPEARLPRLRRSRGRMQLLLLRCRCNRLLALSLLLGLL